MSGHTPWRFIKHKRDEREAVKKAEVERARADLQRVLTTTIKDILLDQTEREYGLSFQRVDVQGGFAWLWARCPLVQGDWDRYVSNFILYSDHTYKKHLYHHERVGLFGGTAFDLGEFDFVNHEAVERDLKREFFRSMRKAAKDLRNLELPPHPYEVS